MKKTCMDCGDSIIGRSDKKFCNDFCRNSYHNRFSGQRNAMMRYINAKLRRNRHILYQMVQCELVDVSRSELNDTGFDWQFFTEEHVQKQAVRRFIYDFGLEYSGKSDQFRIISREYQSPREFHLRRMLAAEEAGHEIPV
ncbi:MAG: hypothetical protein ACKOQY_09755 [Bacteroidota bacterium]